MKATLFAGAAALALAGEAAIAKTHVPIMSVKVSVDHFHFIAPPRGGGYSQRDDDGGISYVCQNFLDSAFSAYDTACADDFNVKKKAKITQVQADGLYFNGSGPAQSFEVTFYKNNDGLPGKAEGGCHEATYSDETGFGTPDISCAIKIRNKGTNWVGVAANMAFSSGGEWGWNTNKTVRGNSAVIETPGGGTCQTWCPIGADFSYALVGKVR